MNLNLLNVESRVKQLRLVHRAYDLLQLVSFIPSGKLCNFHHHNTRSNGYNFLVPNCEGVEDSTFYYIGIKDWNSPTE